MLPKGPGRGGGDFDGDTAIVSHSFQNNPLVYWHAFSIRSWSAGKGIIVKSRRTQKRFTRGKRVAAEDHREGGGSGPRTTGQGGDSADEQFGRTRCTGDQ